MTLNVQEFYEHMLQFRMHILMVRIKFVMSGLTWQYVENKLEHGNM